VSRTLFLDTSAWVPLLIREEASQRMWEVKKGAGSLWAWSWLQVETEAALARRGATSGAWRTWNQLRGEITWVSLESSELPTLCALNRAIGLRAADAGHLFVFERLFSVVSELELLTLDKEMAEAARGIGLPVHAACP